MTDATDRTSRESQIAANVDGVSILHWRCAVTTDSPEPDSARKKPSGMKDLPADAMTDDQAGVVEAGGVAFETTADDVRGVLEKLLSLRALVVC